MVDYKVQYLTILRFCLYEMYGIVNVDFVRCLYSTVSLTLVRVIETALYKNYYIFERKKPVNKTR